MTATVFRRNTLTLIMLATVAALIARAMLRLRLEQRGFNSQVAADLSYLLVPPVLLLLTIPIWRDARDYVAHLYRRADLSKRVVVVAIAVGILMRLTWWGTTFARVSFGWAKNPAVTESIGPSFSWQCPSLTVLLLGIVVMAVMVPVIEEIVHRGYIYRAALHWGAPVAIVISALIFMVFHKDSTWTTAFVAGLIFATQFHLTGSLWSSTISHATFNLLSQLDWRCLHGRWHLAEQDIPRVDIGYGSLLVVLGATAGLIVLLRCAPGAKSRPGR